MATVLGHPRAGALKAVLAHLRNQPEKENVHRTAALRFWPTNPEVDHVIDAVRSTLRETRR